MFKKDDTIITKRLNLGRLKELTPLQVRTQIIPSPTMAWERPSSPIAPFTITCNISNVIGYQFIADPSLPLTQYRGCRIFLTDTTFKELSADISATPPAGETLDVELVTGWTNHVTYPYETFTPNANGKDIDQAINTAAGNGAGICYQAYTPTTGQLLKLVETLTLNSGVVPVFGFWGANNGAAKIPNIDLAAGLNTVYRSMPTGVNFIVLYKGTPSTDFASVNSLKRVLDPPSTGVYLQNVVVDSSFNYNSASFIVHILP